MERPSTSEALLSVEHLEVRFPLRSALGLRITGEALAVDDVSLQIRRGTTLGLVGESGCGKTTLSRAILRLIPASSGRVVFGGADLLSLDPAAMRAMRRRMQIVFQDPAGSLNPRMTVGAALVEPLKVHRIGRSGAERRRRVEQMIECVGLPHDALSRYPHEFSGGQRQRIGIARALVLEPEFLICDEPVSALDVSVQSQILNLLADLQRDLGLTYLFIAHNLAVVRHISDEVAVMRAGRIVELAPADQIYRNPQHPYTQTLLAASIEPPMPAHV